MRELRSMRGPAGVGPWILFETFVLNFSSVCAWACVTGTTYRITTPLQGRISASRWIVFTDPQSAKHLDSLNNSIIFDFGGDYLRMHSCFLTESSCCCCCCCLTGKNDNSGVIIDFLLFDLFVLWGITTGNPRRCSGRAELLFGERRLLFVCCGKARNVCAILPVLLLNWELTAQFNKASGRMLDRERKARSEKKICRVCSPGKQSML